MQRLEHEVEILRKQLADKGPDTSVALRVDPGARGLWGHRS